MSDDLFDPALDIAVRQLREESQPPPMDMVREAALLAAFDEAHAKRPLRLRRQLPWLAAFTAAAAVLVAVAIESPRRVPRASVVAAPAEFTIVPGAAALPPLESGSLVRVDLPVSLLPTLGVRPPGYAASTVKADLVVGQDGLARAVRLVD